MERVASRAQVHLMRILALHFAHACVRVRVRLYLRRRKWSIWKRSMHHEGLRANAPVNQS